MRNTLRLPRAAAWRANYRTYRALFPLWWTLTGATTAPLLHERRHGRLRDALRVRYLSYRIYRRVVEILDSLLMLQPYRDIDDETRVQHEIAAAQETGSPDPTILAAAWRIKLAVDRRHRGDQACPPTEPRTIGPPASSAPGHVALWLARVAQQYLAITRPATIPHRTEDVDRQRDEQETGSQLAAAVSGRAQWLSVDANTARYAPAGTPLTVLVQPAPQPQQHRWVATLHQGASAVQVREFADAADAVTYAERMRPADT